MASLKEFLENDMIAYGVVMPVVGAGTVAVLTSMGVPLAAAGTIGLPLGGAITGVLKGLAGAENTRGMSAKELDGAMAQAAVAGALIWAGGNLMNVKEAAALMKAAEEVADTATQGAAAPGSAGIVGLLAFAFGLFATALGSIAIAEWIADKVRK